jgi:hypothetical protein
VVELAIVLPILALLLFGCLEIGALFGDLLVLVNAAREGVRAGIVGAPTAQIDTVIQTKAASLNLQSLQVQKDCRYRTGGGWSGWQTLGDAGAANDAMRGDQVRIRLTYDHPLVTGRLFSILADEPGGSTVEISAARIMRRE